MGLEWDCKPAAACSCRRVVLEVVVVVVVPSPVVGVVTIGRAP